MDEGLYVRAYHGQKSRWYQAALKQRAGRITSACLAKEVVFEPVDDSLNDRIDEAYRMKHRTSSYLGAMIGARARGATIRVAPQAPG